MNQDLDVQLANAVKNRDLELVKELILKGANVLANNGEIIVDAVKNNYDIFKLLAVKAIIDFNNVDFWNGFLLRLSAENGHLDMVKFLVQNGADIHMLDDYALLFAAENGHLDVVKFLVQNGANIQSRSDRALRFAAQNGQLDVIEFLVKNGADIHDNDDEALREASENGHKDVVKFLMDQYQDKNEAYEIVKEFGNTDIQTYLKDLYGFKMLNGKMINSMQHRLPTELLYNIEKRMGGKKSKKNKNKKTRRKNKKTSKRKRITRSKN